MPSTTIKVEPDLYSKVGSLKAPGQSITAYVRTLIEREYSQNQQALAAQKYQLFLAAHPEEAAALKSWESAPLSEPPAGA
jgi:predicted CopG family antitoxin